MIEEIKDVVEEVCKKYGYDSEDKENNDSLKTVLLKAVTAMLKDANQEERNLFYQMLRHTPMVITENLTKEGYKKLVEQYIGNINPHIIKEDIDLGEYGKKVGAGAYVSEPILDENMQLVGKKSFVYVQKVDGKVKEFFGSDINVSHLIHELGHAWAAEKDQYIMSGNKILKERYPYQIQKVAEHCRDNPNSVVFENVKVFSGLRCNNKKNIFYLVQSDFREDASDNVGGTQLHVKDLTLGLKNEYNVFVAARDYNYLNVTGYIGDKEYFFKFYIGEKPKYPIFYDKRMADLYGQLLEAFRIDLVHIHHTYGLTLDLYKQSYEREIPVYVTLHDYYSICPMLKMLDQKNDLCIGKDSEARCTECLNEQQDIAKTVNYIKIWREEFGSVLKQADKIIVPSESAGKIIVSYYSFLKDKICVIEHGSNVLRKIERADEKNKKFHVAFLGGISPAKGSEYAFQMVKNSSSDIEWFLFGMFGHNDLSMMNRRNFHKIGGYKREDLPDLMEKYRIDLICILPIWPETFCYTISEAVLCGIPVLATEIGAVGERVKALGCGWTVPHGTSYQDILKKIDEE